MALQHVITSFILAAPVRVRVAGALDRKDTGEVAFVSNGKVYNNIKYDNTWHTFDVGSRFDLVALVDKTDTYLMLATEKLSEIRYGDDEEESIHCWTETNGVFLRRASFEKITASARPVEEGDLELEDPKPDLQGEEEPVDFGTVLTDVTTTTVDSTESDDQAAAAK
jgi:hypothetical protein